MKKDLKAALLSTAVYPGAGHYFLKKHVTCFIFVTVFSIPLLLILNQVIDKTNKIAELIVSGEIPLQLTSITEVVTRTITDTLAQESAGKLYFMLFIWLVAALDAYRLGRMAQNS